MAMKFFGGTNPTSEKGKKVDGGQKHDTGSPNQAPGLTSRMVAPLGSLSINNGSGGAPTVASGGGVPNPPLLGPTNMSVGSSQLPPLPSNIYAPGKVVT